MNCKYCVFNKNNKCICEISPYYMLDKKSESQLYASCEEYEAVNKKDSLKNANKAFTNSMNEIIIELNQNLSLPFDKIYQNNDEEYMECLKILLDANYKIHEILGGK